MSKHTPGPWARKWNSGSVDIFRLYPDGSGLRCPHAKVSSLLCNFETAEANADLISAAPDLLRLLAWALPEVEERLRQDLSDGGIGMAEDFDRLYEAKELIKLLGGGE